MGNVPVKIILANTPLDSVSSCGIYAMPKYSKPEGKETKMLYLNYRKMVIRDKYYDVSWAFERTKVELSNEAFFGIFYKCGRGTIVIEDLFGQPCPMSTNMIAYKETNAPKGSRKSIKVQIKFKKPGTYAIAFGAMTYKIHCGYVEGFGQVCSEGVVFDSWQYAVFIVI